MQCLLWYHRYRCYKEGQQCTLEKSLLSRNQSQLFRAVPYETMILISVSDYNQFSQDYYDSVINNLPLHRLTCTCGHSACLSIHAYYKRGIFLPDGTQFLRICRVRCSECGRTHALLLTSIVPYDRISLVDQHAIVCAYEAGSDRNAVCESNPSIDENNVKSVIRRYVLFWLQRLLAEAISLLKIRTLIRDCISFYSMQFMQIHKTAAKLFSLTT